MGKFFAQSSSLSYSHGTILRRWCATLGFTAALGLQAQTIAPIAVPLGLPLPDQPIQLGKFRVASDAFDETVDPTGMDAPEAERSESPFSNDLVMAETVDENALDEIGAELSAISAIPAADAAAGVNRVNLKGFPTPRQRNGFTQVGRTRTAPVFRRRRAPGRGLPWPRTG